jgi:hypothetical protein
MISVNINADTAIQLIVGVGSSVLALLLMLIKLPQSDYSSKLASSKHAIVVSFLLCGFLMFYTIGMYGSPDIWDWEMFTMLTIYIVVHFSTSIISYSMISLLKMEKNKRQNLFMPGLFVSAIVAFLLIESYRSGNQTFFWTTVLVALTAFLIQSIAYIVYFDRAFKQSVKDLENFYDDDESHRIRWVKFCYVISMLTNLFVLVYLGLYWILDYKMEVASLYTIWYLVYMLYFTSNYISFLSSHKLVLDAFAYKTLSGQELMKRINSRRIRKAEEPITPEVAEKEFRELEEALERWVAEKRWREYDKSREQIASELNTLKDILHHYFILKKGKDF